jgi:hypothetical protein
MCFDSRPRITRIACLACLANQGDSLATSLLPIVYNLSSRLRTLLAGPSLSPPPLASTPDRARPRALGWCSFRCSATCGLT